MDQDLELFRKIMFYISEHEPPDRETGMIISIPGYYDPKNIEYFYDPLVKYDLVNGKREFPANPFYSWMIYCFTDKGWKFYNKIKEDGDWKTAISNLEEEGLEKTIENLASKIGINLN